VTLIICPGVHDLVHTDRFIRNMDLKDLLLGDCFVLPTQCYPPYSAAHVLHFWHQLDQSSRVRDFSNIPLILIAFSAGVVGAMGAAWAWQHQGGCVEAMIAVDGWGVPRLGEFPLYRVSHDPWTHWSSACLGGGSVNFYADPPVSHLHLWTFPHLSPGWAIQTLPKGKVVRTPTTASQFITQILAQHISRSS
jgi:hypothetical protein